MIRAERQFATSGRWALGSDGLQWILYRRRSEEDGGWKGVSFVRSTRAVLARCMREKGCSDEDTAVLLAGLPETYDEWLKALNPLPAAPSGILSDGVAYA
jgi:hypothetical protein